MDLGYQETQKYKCSQLPFVTSNIDYEFLFVTTPSYEIMAQLQTWGNSDDKTILGTKYLASKVLISVSVPEGSTYSLNTEEDIEGFIEATSLDFLCNVIFGWLALIAQDRLKKSGNYLTFLEQYTETKSGINLQKPSLPN